MIGLRTSSLYGPVTNRLKLRFNTRQLSGTSSKTEPRIVSTTTK